MSSTTLFDRGKRMDAEARSHAADGSRYGAFLVCTITFGEDEVALHIPAKRAPQFAAMVYEMAETLRAMTIPQDARENPVTVALAAGVDPDTLAAASVAPREDTRAAGAESEDERE